MYYLIGWDHDNKLYCIYSSYKLEEVEAQLKCQRVSRSVNDWRDVAIMQRIK